MGWLVVIGARKWSSEEVHTLLPWEVMMQSSARGVLDTRLMRTMLRQDFAFLEEELKNPDHTLDEYTGARKMEEYRTYG